MNQISFLPNTDHYSAGPGGCRDPHELGFELCTICLWRMSSTGIVLLSPVIEQREAHTFSPSTSLSCPRLSVNISFSFSSPRSGSLTSKLETLSHSCLLPEQLLTLHGHLAPSSSAPPVNHRAIHTSHSKSQWEQGL